jgi:small subunit ribosomal protein S7e
MVLTSITTKLQKKNNQRASDIENNVAQTILEIQNGADAATKEQLMQLNINAVKEIDVGGRNALILMVPAPQVAGWQKVQTKIVRELEKKFSGKHVLIIGARKVMAKEAKAASSSCYKQKRPISRSVKVVHEAILEDCVFPAEITGKRIRHKMDDTVVIKAFLDRSSQTNVEHKTSTFSAVYKRLTGKNVVFEFPEYEL